MCYSSDPIAETALVGPLQAAQFLRDRQFLPPIFNSRSIPDRRDFPNDPSRRAIA